jgi:anhydro-N-acetylmuramic acid kinase
MVQHKTIAELARQKQLRVAGLMSGTSADGVDVAIVDITSRSQQIVAFGTTPYPTTIRKAIFRLCDSKTSSIENICHYHFLLGRLFAKALMEQCKKNKIALSSINLIGSHGQTIYHNPSGIRHGKTLIRSTLQIAEPSIIAQQTGITTVADFRPADIACGGQGAPLVPFIDYRLFANRRFSRAIQNIGGIANVTYLPAASTPDDIVAFDTGPGNMILDGLMTIITHGKKTYDRNGALAAKGTIHQPLLRELLKHPFFRRRPPKTAGRENFGLPYCQTLYRNAISKKLHPEDILATATAFTAVSIAEAYRRFLPADPDQIILCGGGAQNHTLVNLLRQQVKPAAFFTTSDFGIDSDAKEAVSFAILAWCTLKGVAGNVPAATGAAKPAILGKIIPIR